MADVSFRYATEADVPLIMSFINAMAVYEKMADQVVVTEELVRESIFEKKEAEILYAVVDGVEVGQAVFFHNYSTFLGRAGLYLEDLFVLPEYRGKGYGKALLRQLARIAVERNYGRFEWICLDWNESALSIYRSIGATPLSDWTVQRLDEQALNEFAK